MIARLNEDALFLDGFDDALIGCCLRGPTGKTVAVYDRETIIETMLNRDGMSYMEAVEYFDFNIEGAYVGESTPLIVSIMDADKIELLKELDEDAWTHEEEEED
tara:strand:+ start:309 stop:620 length:312 start_codon:yes stop_codon:yes gene_type:complete